LEAALRKQFGVPVTLIQGDGGIFEVRADGALFFSKKECGDRFPTGAEIIALLEEQS
jgi:predicted Rdx family selenoprotein